MPSLNESDFLKMFGGTSLSLEVARMIEDGNWSYNHIAQPGRDAIVIDLLHRIEHGKFTIAANGDKSRWEKGWWENLHAYTTTGDTDALIPKYIRPSPIVRLGGDFVAVGDHNFELNWYRVFRRWFFETYLSGFDHIFEFGCGSGHNVAVLAEMYPGTRIHGLDWAEASVGIIETMAQKGMNVEGHLFDFFEPDEALVLPPNSAVVTMGALEQTGARWQKFMDYLMRNKPALCVHAEPVLELYDPENLADYTAIEAHFARSFWLGFPRLLENLAATGIVDLKKQHRTGFGSLVLEGYSQIVWSPK